MPIFRREDIDLSDFHRFIDNESIALGQGPVFAISAAEQRAMDENGRLLRRMAEERDERARAAAEAAPQDDVAVEAVMPERLVIRRAREYDDDADYLCRLVDLANAVYKDNHKTRAPTQRQVERKADYLRLHGFSRATIRRILGRCFPEWEHEPWSGFIPYWRQHKDDQ
jgi:hypothetical protein